MDTRDSKGRFLPGSVGNPKGRPKKEPIKKAVEYEILDSARIEAITRLIELVHSEDDTVAIQACIEILDRTLGTPEGGQKFLLPPIIWR